MAKARKRRDQDPVIGLISGRMVPKKDSEGKVVMVFQAFKLNPHPTLHELRKVKGDRFSEDQILTFEGLRHLPMEIDREVFIKDKKAKAKLKEMKKEHKSTLVKAGFDPNQRLNVSMPMVLGNLRSLRALARA